MKFLGKGAKKIPQEDYAEIARTVHDHQRNQIGSRFSSAPGQGATLITVRNDSGQGLPFGSVLGISDVPNIPDTPTKLNLFKYDGNALVCGDIPTSADSGKFLITQEPCIEGGFCKAVISGPAKVQIDVISESHGFADVTDGDTVLTSGDTGVPILWKEAGTGEKWAIVNIGGGGGGTPADPWMPYQQAAWVDAVGITLRISGDGSTINNLHADNDDLAVTPLDIIVPPSQTLYAIWVDCTVTPATGVITARTIDHGAAMPAQPASGGAGLAPANLYILLCEITTGDDVARTWEIASRTTRTALGAGRYLSSESCAGGTVSAAYSMAWWRV